MIPSMRRLPFLSLSLGVLLANGGAPGRAEEAHWPPVAEVASRLRQELPSLPEPRPAETNAAEYLRSLAPRVVWPTPEPAGSAVAPLARTNLYPGKAAYLRVAEVGPDLPRQLRAALAGMRGSGELAGVVLDLRFASGSDYAAAAATASLFADRPLSSLRLGDQPLEVARPDTAPVSPVMVLVHRRTRGAAEALASAVRSASGACLLLGTNTAGEARRYRALDLGPGLTVQIADAPLVLPGGAAFPLEGLAPDIAVAVSPEDEARYFTNEFHRLSDGRTPRHPGGFRLNEAELVRQMRGPRIRGSRPIPSGASPEGDPSDAEGSTPRTGDSPGGPVVQDPVLARALDLISGLASRGAAPAVPESSGDSR